MFVSAEQADVGFCIFMRMLYKRKPLCKRLIIKMLGCVF